MEINEATQKLQQFIIGHNLPKTDMALFGIKCPYCGKPDRIRQLEEPEILNGEMEPEVLVEYDELWTILSEPDGSLGVCKFCQNPLKISVEKGRAQAIYE